jgi:probable F420-dependent oxidoreductase
MRFGATMFCTDYSMTPAAVARALEERGFESLWLPEHSHIPSSRSSSWPQGGELPRKYYDVVDPFVALATAATATRRLKLATGICLVAQRDPIQTAKAVASLDSLSEGRFLFGIGAGWNAEEMADHGTAFAERFQVMAERVAAMRAIWTEPEAEYHGTHVEIPPMKTWPKPAQKPHPPVIVGGEFPHGARRALAYGDGWAPHAHRPGYELADVMPRFWEMAAAAGRGPDEVPVSVFGAEAEAGEVERYVETGAARVVFNLPSAGADEVLPLLDLQADLIGRFREGDDRPG